jgi:hypothetical protein
VNGPAVKVLCGYCGRKLGEVIASPERIVYQISTGPLGGTASGPAEMWCPDHGWPDLASEAFRAKLARAPATHTAKMMPRPPSPS